jgi:hypothetical protein
MIHRHRNRSWETGKAGLAALLILFGMPLRVQGAETVSLNFDPYQIWAYYEQGVDAFNRDDLVEAYRTLNFVWPLYNQMRNSPGSPFPQDSQFYDGFKAGLEHLRRELIFWTQQFPADSQREYATLVEKFNECQFRLTGRDIRYSYQLPGQARPSKPKLGHVPPPRR